MSTAVTTAVPRWERPIELTPAYQTVFYRRVRIDPAATAHYRSRSAERSTALGSSPNSDW